ncbi:winged helix-turn-helix domain-containing protein [Arthrobacter sp. CJ23]|uniref:winged helix-turn-helix domain-containing protein n=1 Tax=Arthrobacter sp. CJ23 TaxID=2972479 RepID=UPI00215BE08E|nr:winged helix-turn-helix domain-containing protein [Arthrobacter sp. CJ23]UVJ39057.1 winged helix-turn-helix domain-containing protein [Arthrobacter sp. CJ23]
MAVNAYGPPPGRTAVTRRPGSAGRPGLNARGLALWVQPGENQDIDPVVWARAAEMVLARALKLAPSAEVRIWPADGAAKSGVGAVSWGGTPQDTADAGTYPAVTLADALGQAVPAGAGEALAAGSTAVAPVSLAVRRSQVAIDLAADTVLLDGVPVSFTGMEYKLLRYLVVNCSRAISREELQRFLESFDLPGAAFRSIDVYVGRVRRKLHAARHVISTVRGGGYQFVPGPHATVRGPAEYSI